MMLPRAFYDRLGTLAESLGVSRFHVLLGALYLYFARTGQCAEAGRARLSDVGLSYESHDYDAIFAEIPPHITPLLHAWEQMPLQLFVRDFHAEQDVRVDFVYNQAYFIADEIRALHERFRMVLETALSDPHGSIASWWILPEAERQQVLVEWNATEADYPKDQCVHQLFEAQAERSPEAIALVFEQQSLT
jgi:non-ribosomal peptide synthetase component F